MLDGSPVPGLPLRVPAQDRVPAAATRARPLRDVWARRATATRCSSTCTCRSARCAAASATCSPGPTRRPSRCAAYLRQLRREADAVARRAGRGARSPPARSAAARRPTSTAAELERAVRHRGRRRRPDRRPAVGRDLAGHRHAGPARGAGRRTARTGSASACRASSTPRPTPPAGRSDAPTWTRALAAIRDAGDSRAQHRPDLRHRRPDAGDAGSTRSTRRCAWRPEELYLYPLYVRPLTGLGRRTATSDAGLGRGSGSTLYRQGRDMLARRRATGRCRCACSAAPTCPTPAARLLLPGRRHGRPRLRRPLVHHERCTTRSTTRSASAACAAIIDDYLAGRRRLRRRRGRLRARRGRAAPPLAGQVAAAGRRAATAPACRARFGDRRGRRRSPSSHDLADRGLARRRRRDRLRLTDDGLAHADAIGPWLFSAGGAGARWREYAPAMNLDPLPRPAGELQLRLPVLPVRQAAGQPGAAARRPRRAGALRRLGHGATRTRTSASSVLFTPWGEALTRPLVPRRAWCELSRLSARGAGGDPDQPGRPARLARRRPTGHRLALWARTTPARCRTSAFLRQCRTLDALGVRYTVGVVGLPEHLPRRGAPRCAARCRRASTCG